MSYTVRQVVFGADTSNLTGTDYFVGDLRQITLSLETSTGSASRFTVVGTNSDGFSAGLPTKSQTVSGAWSVITTVLGAGQFTVDAGFRWINAFRPNFAVSASSNATLILAGTALK